MGIHVWRCAILAALLFSAAVPVKADPAIANPSRDGRQPWMVGALLLNPIAAEVFKHIRAVAPWVPDLKISSNGAVKDVEEFCSGPGDDTPSILGATRRMGFSEFEKCTKNGVVLIEIQVGVEALVLVTRKEDPDLRLTFKDLYWALAADLPVNDDFLPNTSFTWQDVNPRLPDRDIRVIVPGTDTAARVFVNNRFLQGVCREMFEYKNIFSAEERVAQCTNLRKDGPVVQVNNPFTVETIRKAFESQPRGTIAIMSLRYASQAKDVWKTLPLEGVMPDTESVSTLRYPAVRPMFVYVKRQHVKDYLGNGPVLGLREFISEITRERATGDNGYLVPLGVVPMPARKRAEIRDAALTLTPMSR